MKQTGAAAVVVEGGVGAATGGATRGVDVDGAAAAVERSEAEEPTRVGAAGGGGNVCLNTKTSHKQWPKMSANSRGGTRNGSWNPKRDQTSSRSTCIPLQFGYPLPLLIETPKRRLLMTTS